jgi:hypothetical protein
MLLKLMTNDFFNPLDSNKITSIDPHSFSNLRRLKKIWINFNVCINRNFESQTQITSTPALLISTCSDSSENSVIPSQSTSEFEQKIIKLQTDLDASKAENSKISLEVTQCQQRVAQILDLQGKWEARWDATYAFKTNELYEELKKRKNTIEEKDRRIRVLETQIAALTKGPN